jgi:hypothetical protein
MERHVEAQVCEVIWFQLESLQPEVFWGKQIWATKLLS